MLVFYAYFVFVIVIAIFLKDKLKTLPMRKFAIFLYGFPLVLISGFRHSSVGNDTIGYLEYFNSVAILDFKLLLEEREPGFSFLIKLISGISTNPVFLLTCIATLFTTSISVIIYRYSKSYSSSYILLVSLGIFVFSMTGLRQILAMSILIASVEFIFQRRLFPFLLFCLLSFFVHNTALIFIPAYFLYNVKFDLKHLLAFLTIGIIANIFQEFFFIILFKLIYLERFIHYENAMTSLSLSGFYIQLIIIIFCAFSYKNIIYKNHENMFFFNLMIIGVLFQFLTPIFAEFFRVSLYFNIFSVILVSNVIKGNIKFEHSFMKYLCVVLISIFYFSISSQNRIISDYKFFWQ